MVDFDNRAVQAAIRALLRRNRALLDAESIEHVESYAGQEQEMALESLCLDLMARPEVSFADLEEMARLCAVVGLDRESVYDSEFWAHFSEALEARRSTDVPSVDRALRQLPPLDCELDALVNGALSARVGPYVLCFENVRFVSAPRTWRLDPTRPVLCTLGAGDARCGEDEAALRLAFGIGGEHTIYEMRAQGLDSPVRVAARSMRWTTSPRREAAPAAAREGALDGVDAIDQVLRGYPWLDCELGALHGGRLQIVGGVDLHGPPPDLCLHFEGVEHLHAPSDWKTDTSRPVLVQVVGDEAAALRQALGLGPELQIVEMVPEDQEGRCRIVARAVWLAQTRTPSAPLRLPPEWSRQE